MTRFRVNVSDLVGKPGSSRHESFSEHLEMSMDMATVAGPLETSVRFDATSQDIVASGRVEFHMRITCNRCLGEADGSGSVRFEQVYRYQGEIDPDDELMVVDRQGVIDLEPPIRDEVGLALPLAPLCRDDCAGLCPTCGTDLNTDPCDGHEDLSSSPFAVLEEFLDPQD